MITFILRIFLSLFLSSLSPLFITWKFFSCATCYIDQNIFSSWKQTPHHMEQYFHEIHTISIQYFIWYDIYHQKKILLSDAQNSLNFSKNSLSPIPSSEGSLFLSHHKFFPFLRRPYHGEQFLFLAMCHSLQIFFPRHIASSLFYFFHRRYFFWMKYHSQKLSFML
jgi:hypothetical protein